MIAAVALDTVAALAIVAAAAVWLARRTWKTMVERTSGGCGCPGASSCGASRAMRGGPTGAGGGPGLSDLRAAAARAVERLESRSR